MSGSAACRAYCSTRSLCRWSIATPTRLHPLLSLANSRHGTATRDTWLKALVTSCPAYSSSPYANPNRPRLEIALAFAPMPVLRSTGCWSCVSVSGPKARVRVSTCRVERHSKAARPTVPSGADGRAITDDWCGRARVRNDADRGTTNVDDDLQEPTSRVQLPNLATEWRNCRT